MTQLSRHQQPFAQATPVAARTRIKMCGFTRQQDVDAAVLAGADAIGFVLYEKSPRFVCAQRAAKLAQNLPPFVTPVLLFVNQETSKVIAACNQVTGSIMQFHGDETPADCWLASGQGKRPFVRAARLATGTNAQPFDLVKFATDFAQAQAILLDAHSEAFGGGGQTFNWSLLPPNVNAHLILSGGLSAGNVIDGIRQLRRCAKSLSVDVSSGIEVPGKKGIKDPGRMREFVAAVRQVDLSLSEKDQNQAR